MVAEDVEGRENCEPRDAAAWPPRRRAYSACFDVYGEGGDPVGWFFVGHTMD
jgi:hypothetical protein